MRLHLTRYGSIMPQGTLGELVVLDDDDEVIFACVTIERPWENNLPFRSCIPVGKYRLTPIITPKHGKTWALENHMLGVSIAQTPGIARYAILIHSANFADDIEGCIAPGENFSGMSGKFMVTSSRHTCAELALLLGHVKDYEIEIKWKEYNEKSI